MNLLATDQSSDILTTRRILLAPRVLAEALFIYSDEIRSRRTPIDEPLMRTAQINYEKTSLSNQETISAVHFAQTLGDGEAESLAIALHRSIPILTDDVGAIKVAASQGITVITTLDLIKERSEIVSSAETAAMLKRMQKCANYSVPRSHHLRDWFLAAADD